MLPLKWPLLSKELMKLFKKKIRRHLLFTFKSFISLVVFLLLIGGVIFFFRSDYFKINSLSCEKDGLPCSEKERALFVDMLGANIFLIESHKIIQSVKDNHPPIKQVTIEKKLINKVFVKLVERKELMGLTTNGKDWFIIDDEGFIFRQVYQQPKNLPLVYFENNAINLEINHYLDGEQKTSLLSIFRAMEDNFIFLGKVVVGPHETITLFLGEGAIASLSARKKITSQVDSLQFILRQSKIEGNMPSRIDLRFDKPVVVF
jgi:hypothetical protein